MVRPTARILIAAALFAIEAGSATTGSPVTAWRAALGGGILAGPCFSRTGAIITGSLDGRLTALDHFNGTALWSVDLGAPVASTPLLAPSGALLVGAGTALMCIDNQTGATIWRAELGGAPSPAATGGDGNVFVGSTDGVVSAFTASGEPLWTYATDLYITGAPTPHGDVVFVASGDASVVALSASNGTLLWRSHAPSGPVSSPTVSIDGSMVYVSSLDGGLYALRSSSGETAWTAALPYAIISSPPALGRDGTVYVAHMNGWGLVVAFDGASGAQRWNVTVDDVGIWSTPAVSDAGGVFVASLSGNVSAITPDGVVSWQYPVGRSFAPPLLDDAGILFVGTEAGYVYALAESAPPPLKNATFSCASDWDCTLSGECVAGACVCDKPWTGPSCAVLKFLPAPPGALEPFLPLDYPTHQTWGCAPFMAPDGRACAYFDYVVGSWYNDTYVAPWSDLLQGSLGLACASDPLGPYTQQLPEAYVPFRESEFDAGFLQNSLMVKLADGGWLLVATTAPASVPRDMHDWSGSGGEQYVAVATAADPFGPWTRTNHTILVPSFSGFEQGVANNPALIQLADGTFSMQYRGGKDYGYGSCTLPTWNGTCTRPRVNQFANDTRFIKTEDGFSYKGPRGYILISHRCWDRGGGTKAISRDGLAWAWAGSDSYTYSVELTNGTTVTFSRREEPKLLFDATGRPTHMFNAVGDTRAPYKGGVSRWIVQALDYS